MPIAAATLAKIQEIKAESLATLMHAIEPVEAAARLGARHGSGMQASQQSAEAAMIRAVIVTPPENGQAVVRIAGGLVEVMVPPDLMREAATNPQLLKQGATLLLPANIPARSIDMPATIVNVSGQNATGASVGPAPPLANPFPPGSLGALVARLAGIAFPGAEAEDALPPPRGEAVPSIRPGALAKPLTPELAETMLRATSRQVPIGAALNQILSAAEAAPETLPPLLAHALRALAGLRAAPTDLANPAGLREAIQRSGLFLEAMLATGSPPPPAGDLKSALLALRAALAEPESDRPALPRDPAATSSRIADPAHRIEIARAVEGAIERLKLAQIASMPDHPEISYSDERANPLRVALQVPVATQGPDRPQTAMIGLVVEHNPVSPEPASYQIENEGGGETAEGFPWKVRVALDLEETGPVQAEIALRGQSVAVTLWAERKAVAGRAREEIAQLHDALTGAAFEVVRLEVKDGRPIGRLPRATHMLDRRT